MNFCATNFGTFDRNSSSKQRPLGIEEKNVESSGIIAQNLLQSHNESRRGKSNFTQFTKHLVEALLRVRNCGNITKQFGHFRRLCRFLKFLSFNGLKRIKPEKKEIWQQDNRQGQPNPGKNCPERLLPDFIR